MYGRSSSYIVYCPLYGRCPLFGVSAKRGSTVYIYAQAKPNNNYNYYMTALTKFARAQTITCLTQTLFSMYILLYKIIISYYYYYYQAGLQINASPLARKG